MHVFELSETGHETGQMGVPLPNFNEKPPPGTARIWQGPIITVTSSAQTKETL